MYHVKDGEEERSGSHLWRSTKREFNMSDASVSSGVFSYIFLKGNFFHVLYLSKFSSSVISGPPPLPMLNLLPF